MAYLLRWWLAAELIGLLTLPLTFRIFRGLPDRGYAFARLFGILLITYVLWLGGTIGLLPYSSGSTVLCVLVLGAAGVAVLVRHREELLAWARASKAYVAGVEIAFIAVMLLVALLRSYQPAIANTEKPFEFGNLNAVHRTQDFAQTDPWMSGKPDAYYYYGYVVVDSVAKLTGTPTNYAFNVGLIFIAGLSAVAAFGLAANLAGLLRGHGVSGDWPLLAGSLAVVLLLVIGNLEGIFEFGAAHGLDPGWAYHGLGIKGLIARPSAHWWPDEPGFGPWWRATRLGSDWNFLEFPFFSFLLGDLHPHVLALPFMLLAAAFGLGIARAKELPRRGRVLAGWPLIAGATLALGVFVGLHPWDFPPLALLIGGMLAWRIWRQPERDWKFAAGVAGAVMVAGLVLFLPFFFSERGSTNGIQPTEVVFRNPVVQEATGMYLPFQHFLLFWTPLMLPAVIFVLRCLGRRRWKPLADYGPTTLALVVLLPIAWAVAVTFGHGSSGLRQELGARGGGWLTVVALALILASTLAAAWAEVQEPLDSAERDARLFLLAVIAISVLLVYGPELFFVRDSSGTRANSTFKLWYCSWALLSVAGSAGGLWALWQWRPANPLSAIGRPITAGLGVAVLAGALVYPLYASFSRTVGFNFLQANGYKGSPTLDGLQYLQHINPDEFGAAAWLNQNVKDVQTIVESVGGSYTEGGRVSSRTGLPTVLDWPFHELQQRNNPALIAQRQADVQKIYQTQDVNEAFRLLALYGVKYVVSGQQELMNYGGAGLAKFAQIGTPVYTAPSVTIYRIGPAPLFAAAP
ncbi:MAG: DUF2298 domain-containing protein [Dehalococcoidia bacterium]